MVEKLKIVIKILGSLGFMWLALSRVDLAALQAVLSKANLLFIVFSALFLFIAVAVMVLRWELLLRLFHKNIHYTDLFSIYWIGLFFNLFLPSAVGGDVVKMYKLSKKHGKPVESSTTVLMDRVVGLSSLTFLALINIVIFWNTMDFSIAGGIIVAVAIILIVFYVLIFNVNIIRKLTWVRKLFVLFKVEKVVKELYLSFNLYKDHRMVIVRSFSVSLFCNLLMSSSLYFIARAVGLDISLFYFFVIMPVVFIIMMIPISISGLGLQDGAYVFFLGQLGVAPTVAFSVSLLAHAVRYGIGLLGGFAYMLERDKIKK
ncbi:lysylphosphatidylglycerol synthase transmembrane domain-containing protein [Candidatus Margulisiibacteriota bacterium]